MAYILRALLLLMISGLLITTLSPFHYSFLDYFNTQHITTAIITFLLLLFIQAFVMFYFIGVHRFTININNILLKPESQKELFEEIPEDLNPYIKKISQFTHKSNLAKRKVIPWTMMMITLGMLTFLLGAAYDTGMVDRVIHKGLAIGLWSSVIIGVTQQWILLGQSYKSLRQIKALFSLPDTSM